MDDAALLAEALPVIADWYARNRRPLPWREDPTAYHIWISEIMLQQTRIEAVLSYYRRFLEELPDLEALAAVEEDRLLKLWEGLGYYSRARNLKKAAGIVLSEYGGVLPRQARELKKLPGIGDYTAGAIASIAYGEPAPAVDGNVLRVLTRLLARSDDIADPKTKKCFTELLSGCYPAGRQAALVTEGLMELGETLCIPNGEARCGVCPLAGLCRARLAGTVDRYPVKAPPKARRIEEKTVFLLTHEGRCALQKRPGTGLLAGMWEFPNWDGALSEAEALSRIAALGGQGESPEPLGRTKHVFTHVEWHMTGWRVSCPQRPEGFVWVTPEQLRDQYAIPTAFRYYLKKAL